MSPRWARTPRTRTKSIGEIYQAIKAGAIGEGKIVELGAVIAGASIGRSDHAEITIADLTGVAVQDIMIAKAVVAHLAVQ